MNILLEDVLKHKREQLEEASSPCTLECVVEPYDRFERSPVRTVKVSGDSLKEALVELADCILLYIQPEDIEEDTTAEDILESIIENNGDGCDFIVSLKDTTAGVTYIDAWSEYND